MHILLPHTPQEFKFPDTCESTTGMDYYLINEAYQRDPANSKTYGGMCLPLECTSEDAIIFVAHSVFTAPFTFEMDHCPLEIEL